MLPGPEMRLRDLMTSPVLTVTMAQPASDALALMREAGVRHAVVVLGTNVVGVLSARDLGGPLGGVARSKHAVAELMQAEPIIAPPAMSVSEAVHLVRERRIGALPILERGRLVGIVTRSDLLRAFDPLARDADVELEDEDESADRPEPVVSPNRDKSP